MLLFPYTYINNFNPDFQNLTFFYHVIILLSIFVYTIYPKSFYNLAKLKSVYLNILSLFSVFLLLIDISHLNATTLHTYIMIYSNLPIFLSNFFIFNIFLYFVKLKNVYLNILSLFSMF